LLLETGLYALFLWLIKVMKDLEALLEPTITALGFELLGYECVSQANSQLVKLYIDSADGVTISDCERISRQVRAVLDVEDPFSGRYRLEVSSPGLDRPLFKLAHYQRFLGSPIKLRLRLAREGQRNFTGKLVKVENEDIFLQTEQELLSVNINDIDKARLIAEL
jgi:ribosome maturation factor RimP